MKITFASFLLLLVLVQTGFSQQASEKSSKKQKNKKTRVKEKGYKINGIVELGFLGVFDHKIQFGLSNNNYTPTYFDYYQVMIDGNTGQIAFFDSISDLHFASANAVDLDLNGRDEVILSLNYHTGTHFEHQLKIVDFPNNSISDLSISEAGVNLGSTPLITDLDGNGFIDFVYAFRADSVNPMGANGFKVTRLEGTYTNPGPGIAWGSYMGNANNGIYNFEVINCGTIDLNLVINNTSCSLFVNLRCMQLFRNEYWIYVGGGITTNSNPNNEWEETELKAQTLLNILD